ncbi:MAG: zinc ribbon domain-containing protein [Candidatus Lokiarchaeota archaeon]|nr:zinc ribbon domain-containing protein [Candidatus Lokiarchaeota archaeon]
MSSESQNPEKKTLITLIILLFLIFTVVAVLTFLIFNVYWIIILPISFIAIVLVAQAFSKLFWTTDKKCPRCNTTVSIYSDFCSNCGFKLLLACPKCQNVLGYDDQICKGCGYTFKKLFIPDNVEIKLALDDKVDEKIDGKLHFCPHCGINLGREQQNLRFCETCGGKLN